MKRQMIVTAGAVIVAALLTNSIAARQTRQYIPPQIFPTTMRQIASFSPNDVPLKQTVLIAHIRRLEQYQEWKRAVFVRDRFTCQHCGKRSGKVRVIEADHIEPLSNLVKMYHLQTTQQAADCAPLWSTENGRTLCRNCHQKTDSYPRQFIKSK